jgi:cytochrome c5
MSEEQMNDSSFSRLFILMMVAMSVLLALLMVLASFTAGDVNARLDERSEQENSNTIGSRIAKVGQFAVQTAEAAAPTTVAEPEVLSGEEAYASCVACHGAGIAGAPKFGDAQAWAGRIEQGLDKLTEHAITGYQGDFGFMPAKGGNASLSDASVRAAVQHMVDAVK